MLFKLQIETGNAAFQDNPGQEIARILREVADQIEGHGPRTSLCPAWFNNGQEQGWQTAHVLDGNGNRVGHHSHKPADNTTD
jgi:hypothetical protein